MYVCLFVCMCLCTTCMQDLWRPEEGVISPRTGVIDVSTACGFWECEQEQLVLLTSDQAIQS